MTPPAGLAEATVASGADPAVPDPSRVAWAGLHWATSAARGPETVTVGTPAGEWEQVTADDVRHSASRPLRQAYADVTELVRKAPPGAWWLAAPAEDVPYEATSASAGWSLTVVYADDSAPAQDVAIFTGPVALDEHDSLSMAAGDSGHRTRVGLVVWEGDRTLIGDTLRLGDAVLGEPANVASSRATGALECRDAAVVDCDWHTFGVDVARYEGLGGLLEFRAGVDKVELGVVGLALEPSG